MYKSVNSLFTMSDFMSLERETSLSELSDVGFNV